MFLTTVLSSVTHHSWPHAYSCHDLDANGFIYLFFFLPFLVYDMMNIALMRFLDTVIILHSTMNTFLKLDLLLSYFKEQRHTHSVGSDCKADLSHS